MIPFMGIVNGLIVPVMFVPPYLLSFSERGIMIYQFSIYVILAVLLALFYFKGRSWREWFDENMKKPRPAVIGADTAVDSRDSYDVVLQHGSYEYGGRDIRRRCSVGGQIRL